MPRELEGHPPEFGGTAAWTRKKTFGSAEVRMDDFFEQMRVWETLRQTGAFRHVGKLMFVTKNKTGSMCMMLDANGPDGEDGDGWEKLKSPPGRSGLFIIQHHDSPPHSQDSESRMMSVFGILDPRSWIQDRGS